MSSDDLEHSNVASSIQQLLSELREQRQEINSLKEEVRGNSQCVKSEVKKIKTVHELKWRYEGNRVQFDFNTELLENLKQVIWGIDNGKIEYASDLLSECCASVKKRNKHLRIADSSEGGWETVRQYECNPVASDTDDESRILRAESRAVRKKKAQQKSHKKPKPTATVTSADVFPQRQVSNAFSTQFPGGQQQQPFPFRPFAASRAVTGPCFACGETSHFRRNCPYSKTAQQFDTPTKK